MGERAERGPAGTDDGLLLADCRRRLREAASRGGTEVAAMVENAKLLRAALVFGSGSPLGAPAAALLPAAVSIELLHLASLVHDDIIDEATERRGVPALHVAVGRDRALVVGDLLVVLAFGELARIPAVPADVLGRCVEALSEGARLCCAGQLAELDPARAVGSEEAYLDVVAAKTGALFSAAASLGLLLAGARREEVAAVAAFGAALGAAYQVRDDLRDDGDAAAGAARFSPTVATYARARDAALGALERVPRGARDGLRALVERML